ncbi:MAG: hypothetical protein KKD94_01490, partial [Nanoarchaeota archaeon]|nr:hypothetical protein [Nanoarchaeota archaeon]
DAYLQGKCYYSLALQDADSSFCDLALYNEDECYRALAKKLNDPSLCENGRVNKCICYTGIAQESRDPSYCEYCLKDEYWYIGSEDYREPHGIQCYRAYAKFGSASDCDELKAQDIREKCYFGFAHTANSIAFCDKITNAAWQDLCYYDARDDLSACEKIIDSQIRDKCYKSFACDFDQPVESICGKIIDKEIKNACYQKKQQCMEPLR